MPTSATLVWLAASNTDEDFALGSSTGPRRPFRRLVPVLLFCFTAILAILTVSPLIWMISAWLKPGNEPFSPNIIPSQPTLENFRYVFTALPFWRYMLNSFFVAGTITVVALWFHSMAGFALARLRFPGREAIFLAIFSTFLVSLPVIIVPLFILVRQMGMVNTYAGLIVPAIFNAFGIFLLRQFYIAIPNELQEAAVIDGASYFRIYWNIMLPLSRPILAALAVFFFLANWNAFIWAVSPEIDYRLSAIGYSRSEMMSNYSFNGLGMSLGNLARLSDAQTRSISAENFSGAKGEAGKATEGTGAIPARELGQGWKVSPSIDIDGRQLCTLADIHGPGAIQHIWLTVHPQFWRRLVLRMFWDNETTPSVEVPLGDFFCNGWGARCNISSLPVAVNPAGGFNSYWEMPFQERALITLENLGPDKIEGFYYQIDHTLTEIEPDRAYFHTQWRRSNPLPYQTVHTILDGVKGKGQHIGTYLAWGVRNNGWCGEGEIKFYFAAYQDWPTTS